MKISMNKQQSYPDPIRGIFFFNTTPMVGVGKWNRTFLLQSSSVKSGECFT